MVADVIVDRFRDGVEVGNDAPENIGIAKLGVDCVGEIDASEEAETLSAMVLVENVDDTSKAELFAIERLETGVVVVELTYVPPRADN